MTPKLFPATYEGNRIIKLNQDLEGFQQHQSVVVMVMLTAAEDALKVDDVGLAGLQRLLAENEKKFGMTSALFSERFLRGELGDDPDYILWAGEYEIYQRFTERDAQAADLRARLSSFAEDWDSQEMSIYDNYDANKANL